MENFDDPFYDGLTQEQKEGVYLHILVEDAAGPGGRMTKARKRELRDEWLAKQALDALPFVQKMKARQAADLRVTCEALWAEMVEWVERIGDDQVAGALGLSMHLYVADRLQPFSSGHPGLDHFLCSVGTMKDLPMFGEW